MYICTHTYTHMHTHIHTYICAYRISCTDCDTFMSVIIAGVELLGSDVDDSTRRKLYIPINELHKRTWNSLNTSSRRTRLNQLVNQLLQLLKALLSAPPPSSSPSSSATVSMCSLLQQYCRENFSVRDSNGRSQGGGGKEEEEEDYFLKLAKPETQYLSLIYADSDMLFEILRSLNMFSSHTAACNSRAMLANLQCFEEFVLFLYSNCRDLFCFFKPIQRVLESTRHTGLSRLFISLITRSSSSLMTAIPLSSETHKMSDFIRCGGGELVLRQLIETSKKAESSSVASAAAIGGGTAAAAGDRIFSSSTINKIGQKDTPPKTISDSSNLVNFLSSCTAYTKKGSLKVPPSSSPPSSSSLFQHTFDGIEDWAQLHLLLPHPILLHNLICCLISVETPSSLGQGVPSKIVVFSSLHSGLESAVPVTPVFDTAGLKLVNIAFRQPVLTQLVTIYFCRPRAAASMLVSRLELLGTHFGVTAEAITSATASSATAPTATPVERDCSR